MDVDRLIDIVERQADRLATLEAQIEAMTPPEEPEPEPVRDVPWSELTLEEKTRLTGQRYG